MCGVGVHLISSTANLWGRTLQMRNVEKYHRKSTRLMFESDKLCGFIIVRSNVNWPHNQNTGACYNIMATQLVWGITNLAR